MIQHWIGVKYAKKSTTFHRLGVWEGCVIRIDQGVKGVKTQNVSGMVMVGYFYNNTTPGLHTKLLRYICIKFEHFGMSC